MKKETVQEHEYRLKQLAKASIQKHNTFRYIGSGKNKIINIQSQ